MIVDNKYEFMISTRQRLGHDWVVYALIREINMEGGKPELKAYIDVLAKGESLENVLTVLKEAVVHGRLTDEPKSPLKSLYMPIYSMEGLVSLYRVGSALGIK